MRGTGYKEAAIPALTSPSSARRAFLPVSGSPEKAGGGS